MKASKIPSFSERLDASTTAKKAALERFRVRPASDDPALVEKRAARQAIAAARELRADERRAKALRDEEMARANEELARAADIAARELAAQEREARQLREGDEQVALEAQRKAARDSRYAARKARKA